MMKAEATTMKTAAVKEQQESTANFNFSNIGDVDNSLYLF
jgi:hypothetical protein